MGMVNINQFLVNIVWSGKSNFNFNSNSYFTVIVGGQYCSIYLDEMSGNVSWNIVA